MSAQAEGIENGIFLRRGIVRLATAGLQKSESGVELPSGLVGLANLQKDRFTTEGLDSVDQLSYQGRRQAFAPIILGDNDVLQVPIGPARMGDKETLGHSNLLNLNHQADSRPFA